MPLSKALQLNLFTQYLTKCAKSCQSLRYAHNNERTVIVKGEDAGFIASIFTNYKTDVENRA